MALAKPIALIVLLFIALLWLVSPARAAGLCGPYAAFVASLAKNYDEISQGKGVANEFVVIEVFASKDTFTILATNPMGRACILAAGRGWTAATPTISGDDT
jgi:hypothetical protein